MDNLTATSSATVWTPPTVWTHRVIIGATMFGMSLAPYASALEVIHDSNDAVPSAQYLSQLFIIDVDNPNSQAAGLPLVSFPIRTSNMAPGILAKTQSINQPAWLVHSVFLIGTDSQSRTWLTTNLQQLQQRNAMGIVVNVDSYAAFREMQQLAVGLALAPASVDGLAQSLGLSVYPVLLQLNGEITQ